MVGTTKNKVVTPKETLSWVTTSNKLDVTIPLIALLHTSSSFKKSRKQNSQTILMQQIGSEVKDTMALQGEDKTSCLSSALE